jgi:hypothetical protein
LAFLGSSTKPPSAAANGLLALLTILSQGGSVWAFSGIGKAGPVHAQRSADRIANLALQLQTLEQSTQNAFEEMKTARDLHVAMGSVTAALSILKENALGAYRDWEAFHPAVGPITKGNDDGFD